MTRPPAAPADAAGPDRVTPPVQDYRHLASDYDDEEALPVEVGREALG